MVGGGVMVLSGLISMQQVSFSLTVKSAKKLLVHIKCAIIPSVKPIDKFKFKRWFCTQKPVLNVRFKDFWNTKNKFVDKFN